MAIPSYFNGQVSSRPNIWDGAAQIFNHFRLHELEIIHRVNVHQNNYSELWARVQNKFRVGIIDDEVVNTLWARICLNHSDDLNNGIKNCDIDFSDDGSCCIFPRVFQTEKVLEDKYKFDSNLEAEGNYENIMLIENLAYVYKSESNSIMSTVTSKSILHQIFKKSQMVKRLVLRKNDNVILTKNVSPKAGLMNGVSATVDSLTDDGRKVKLKLSMNGILVERIVGIFTERIMLSGRYSGKYCVNQLPLMLKAVGTIHKHQGQEHRQIFTTLDHQFSNDNMFYVAISRSKMLHGLHISRCTSTIQDDSDMEGNIETSSQISNSKYENIQEFKETLIALTANARDNINGVYEAMRSRNTAIMEMEISIKYRFNRR